MVVEGRASRVLVVGCGGVGGIVAAGLVERGVQVDAVTGNDAIATALRDRGAVVRWRGGERVTRGVRASAALGASDAGPYDYVLLATQPTQVEAAARAAAPALAPDGLAVCLQNGLCEARVAAVVGEDRVAGAIVAWGASQVGPGVYERTSAGGFVLGYERGGVDARLERLGRLLEGIGPVTIGQNLRGARWSKLAINCAVSALGTIAGERLGVVLLRRRARRLALELMSETVAVARAEGVSLERVGGTFDLDRIALPEHERGRLASPGLVARHAVLLAVGAKFRRMRSSMLAAIERGRPPAVDFLNGEVVDRGAKHGVPTPVNAAAREAIHRIARRESTPSFALVERLFDETWAARSPHERAILAASARRAA